MKLYEQPCTRIRVGRRLYRLRLTYSRVLYALDAIEDPLLTDTDRQLLLLGLLIKGRIPHRQSHRNTLVQAVSELIAPQGKATADQPAAPTMSLTQDAALIHAAFRQAYGIDLHAVDLPWSTFCELLSGLPESTRFCQVVALRARPVPPPDKHNAAYRAELLRAKASVALVLPASRAQQNYQTGLDHLFRSMLAWAEPKGSDVT